MTKRELYKMVCDDIEKENAEKPKSNRNGLKKHFGKRVKYQGVVADLGITRNATAIADIRLYGKNKVLADHLWLNGLYDLKIGDTISFEGIATSYIDASGSRKYKIGSVSKHTINIIGAKNEL